MNKLIKTCIVGGIVYAMCDVSYQLGKGRMLGTLAKTDVSASQCMDILTDDERLRVKFVEKIAEITKNES